MVCHSSGELILQDFERFCLQNRIRPHVGLYMHVRTSWDRVCERERETRRRMRRTRKRYWWVLKGVGVVLGGVDGWVAQSPCVV